MTEGTTPPPDGSRSGTSDQAGEADETVAFAADDALPEPLPARAAPLPPDPAAEVAPTVAAESTPWRSRPAPPGPGPGGSVGPGGPVGSGAPRRDASHALTVVAVGGVVVLVVVIVLMAVVLGGDDDEAGEVMASDTTVPAPPVTAAPGAADLPSGLLCRDLLSQDVGYDLAVAYWLQEGRPPQNDEDLDGVPCETVYPAAAVEAVWGPQGLDEEEGLAPGLLCRDLVAEGLDYNAAVAYWFEEDQPARMDDDGNGRPCETIYPAEEVEAFWT